MKVTAAPVGRRGYGQTRPQDLDDQRKAAGEIVAWTTIEPHLRAVLAGDDSESIVLNLMEPFAPAGFIAPSLPTKTSKLPSGSIIDGEAVLR